MNDSSSKPEPEEPFDRYDSLDCEELEIIFEGPGDNTIRPPRPEYVKLVMERRELHARLMELWQQQQEQEKAKETPNAANGSKG